MIKHKMFFVLVAVFIFTAIPLSSYALDVSIGASGWYANWDFSEKDSPDSKDPDFNSTFLYGPVLSLKFSPDWSFSTTFLYGKFEMTQSMGETDAETTFDLTRMDSDSAINYSINRYFKIFAGFKYMSYSLDSYSMSLTHDGYGPGLGIGISIPLFDNFYLLGNVSGMYLRGNEKQDNLSSDTGLTTSTKNDHIETGYNSNLSLAYYISPASTTITVGYRYQYFTSKAKGAETGDPDRPVADTEKHFRFHGVTFAMIFSFDI